MGLGAGTPTFTATPGIDADGPDMDAFIAEVIDAVETKWVSILRLGNPSNNAGAIQAPYWNEGNNRWELSNAGNELQLQIPFREGWVITDFAVTLYHSGADAAGGTLIMYSQATTPVAGAMPPRTAEWTYANPFNTGGATNYYEITDADTTTIAAKTDYYVSVTGLGAQTCYLTGCNVRAQQIA